MRKYLFCLILAIFFIAAMQAIYAQESYIALNIQLFDDGSALIIGSSSTDPIIKDIEFDSETNDVYGMTQELTSKQGALWNFALDLKSYSSFTVKVFLPERAKVIGTPQSNVPAITSIENKRIFLEFNGYDQEIDISFNYELEKEMKEQKVDWLMLLFLTVLIILIAIALWLILKRKARRKKPKIKKKVSAFEKKIKLIKQSLNERENKIVRMLLKEKGKSTQGRLQRLSGIPKASFSRYIAELERKGLILKHGKGKLNLIELKK